MTIFEAPTYDPKRDRRRALKIWVGVVAVIALAVLVWVNRNWPQEHTVKKFFTAILQKDYAQAYGLWTADQSWQQHPQQHSRYGYNDFYQDWGPSGEWGPIHSFHIDGSVHPPGGTGIVVVVTINERKEPARVWVEKKDKSMTFSPY